MAVDMYSYAHKARFWSVVVWVCFVPFNVSRIWLVHGTHGDDDHRRHRHQAKEV